MGTGDDSSFLTSKKKARVVYVLGKTQGILAVQKNMNNAFG